MTDVLAHSSVLPSAGAAGDRLGRDDAVAADPVFDHELLAERLAQARSGKPSHHVDIAARCERHQDLHRPLRPVLRLPCSRAGHHCQRDKNEPLDILHHAVTQMGIV